MRDRRLHSLPSTSFLVKRRVKSQEKAEAKIGVRMRRMIGNSGVRQAVRSRDQVMLGLHGTR